MQRIFVRHLKLIFVFLQLGLLVGFLVGRGVQPSYSASTRLLFPSAQPTADVSKSLADTAEAIATSRGQIQAVLQDIGTERDPSNVAEKQLQVQSLGDSGVVEVTVTDPDPDVAAALAGGLAERVVRIYFESISEGTRALQADVEDRIAALNGRISLAQQEQASTGQPLGRLAALIERKANLRVERRDLLVQLATLPKPTILDPIDRSAVEPVSSGRAQEIALGGLVGLVLGITLAALLETLRPGVVGREGLRRAFDAPILGTFSPRLDAAARRDVASATRLLGAAAAAAEVTHVKLTRAGKPLVDLNMLAVELQASLSTLTSQELNGDHGREPNDSEPLGSNEVPGAKAASTKTTGNGASGTARAASRTAKTPSSTSRSASGTGKAASSTAKTGSGASRSAGKVAVGARKKSEMPAPLTIDVDDRREPRPLNGVGGTGLVVVTPQALERTEVDRVHDLAAITGWPVLGVISTKV